MSTRSGTICVPDNAQRPAHASALNLLDAVDASIKYFANHARVTPNSEDPVMVKVLQALKYSYEAERLSRPNQTTDQIFKGSALTSRFVAELQNV